MKKSLLLSAALLTLSSMAFADQASTVRFMIKAPVSEVAASEQTQAAPVRSRAGYEIIEVKESQADATYAELKSKGYEVIRHEPITPTIIPPTELEPNPYQYMGRQAKAALSSTLEPNDPEFWRQWHFETLNRDSRRIRYGSGFAQLWNNINAQKRARVAVLDDGFTENGDVVFVDGYNFVEGQRGEKYGRTLAEEAADECAESDFTHGLGVASVLGAIADNDYGIAGVADVDMIAAKVMHCGEGGVFDIADAIIWAAGGEVEGVPSIEKVDVINLSLAALGGDECPEVDQAAIDFAHAQGVMVIAGAGNHGLQAKYTQPANCNHVISVAATDRHGHKASFSAWGEGVDLAAPGVGIIGWGPEGKVVSWSGTSFSTPLVSAAAALARTEFPEISSTEIVHFLLETAYEPETEYDFPAQSCHPSRCGAGILDAPAFISEVRAFMGAEYSSISHALSEGGDCNKAQALIALNGELSLCDSYKVVFDSREVHSESVTYKLYRVPSNQNFALDNAELVTDTHDTALVMGGIDTDEYQYGFQRCANGSCGTLLSRMNLEHATMPETCAAR